MSQTDYEAAIIQFLRTRGVPRYPTVCVVPTQATVADADRAAYRDHIAARKRSVTREEPWELPLPDRSAVALAERLVASGTSPSAGRKSLAA